MPKTQKAHGIFLPPEAPPTDPHTEEGIGMFVKGCMLLALAFYLGRLVWTQEIGKYLNIHYQYLTIFAVVVLFLFGACAMFGFSRRAPNCCDHHDVKLRLKSFAILFPLFLAVWVPNRPLSVDAMMEGGEFNPQQNLSISDMYEIATPEKIDDPEILYGFMEIASGIRPAAKDTQDFTLLDWMRDFASSNDLSRFDGNEATIEGFIAATDDMPAGHFVLSRFFMRHCMFDTFPIGVYVSVSGAEQLPKDSWVSVHGTFQVRGTTKGKIIILQSDDMKFIPEPKLPFLYPQG